MEQSWNRNQATRSDERGRKGEVETANKVIIIVYAVYKKHNRRILSSQSQGHGAALDDMGVFTRYGEERPSEQAALPLDGRSQRRVSYVACPDGVDGVFMDSPQGVLIRGLGASSCGHGSRGHPVGVGDVVSGVRNCVELLYRVVLF